MIPPLYIAIDVSEVAAGQLAASQSSAKNPQPPRDPPKPTFSDKMAEALLWFFILAPGLLLGISVAGLLYICGEVFFATHAATP